MTYSYLITNKAITVTFGDGSTRTIPASDRSYADAVKAVASKVPESRLLQIIDRPRTIAAWSGGSVVAKGNQVLCKTPDGLVPVPDCLVTVLQEFVENDWPVLPFCRFIYRLMQNTSRRSVETLYGYIQNYGITITESGKLRGYKAVTWDFKDKHTGTVDNSIGAKPNMSRNLVDDDPDRGCSVGFHWGCIEYVMSFARNFGQPGGDRIILVEVDPADVVCVPYDCSCGKVRCNTYEVVSEYAGELATFADAGLKQDVDTGAANIEKAKAAVAAAKKPGKRRTRFCRVCGDRLKASDVFCPGCGTRVI